MTKAYSLVFITSDIIITTQIEIFNLHYIRKMS